MSNFASNLKYLRKKKGLTQDTFSIALNIKRPNIGAYEEGRAEPNFGVTKKIADFFDVSMDDIVNEVINDKWKPKPRGGKSALRILSVTVDKDNTENIELVPVKASAGYLNGYADPEYVKNLTRLSLPMFKGGTYRAFEIFGDSMLPVESGSYIISQYVESWKDIKLGKTYIIVSTQEGVVYKRIGQKYSEDKGLKLVSDNKAYDPYWVDSKDVMEVWEAKAIVSTSLPEPAPETSLESIAAMMTQMQKAINEANEKN